MALAYVATVEVSTILMEIRSSVFTVNCGMENRCRTKSIISGNKKIANNEFFLNIIIRMKNNHLTPK